MFSYLFLNEWHIFTFFFSLKLPFWKKKIKKMAEELDLPEINLLISIGVSFKTPEGTLKVDFDDTKSDFDDN